MNLLKTIDLKYYFLIFLVLGVSFAIRVNNLNYNIPFNDEAIYVVLGRLGVFQGDWWSYNAAAWMPGYPYLYPVLSALAYSVGGIVGSRFLNVILGVSFCELVFLITNSHDINTNAGLAGIISMVVVGISTTGLYVSRLATYDLPSFYFLFAGIVALYKANSVRTTSGKWYFIAYALLILAFLCKIVAAIYFPLIVLVSFWLARNKGKRDLIFWSKYFFLPLAASLLLYALLNIGSIASYSATQGHRDKASLINILNIVWTNSMYVWPLYALATIGMFLKKQFKVWFLFSVMASLMTLFHLSMQRPQTLDKHTFLLVAFLAPVVGLGLSNIINFPKNKVARFIIGVLVFAILSLYSFYSYKDAQRFNILWDNSSVALNFFSTHVKPGDKVLAEVGAAAILAAYENNSPTNTTTFDWFEYQKKTGNEAYVAALQDGYFDWIELEREDRPEDGAHAGMHKLIKANLSDNYKVVFKDKGYVFYKHEL